MRTLGPRTLSGAANAVKASRLVADPDAAYYALAEAIDVHGAANKAITAISEVTAPSSVIPTMMSALLPAAMPAVIPVRVCDTRRSESKPCSGKRRKPDLLKSGCHAHPP